MASVTDTSLSITAYKHIVCDGVPFYTDSYLTDITDLSDFTSFKVTLNNNNYYCYLDCQIAFYSTSGRGIAKTIQLTTGFQASSSTQTGTLTLTSSMKTNYASYYSTYGAPRVRIYTYNSYNDSSGTTLYTFAPLDIYGLYLI